MTPPRRFLSHSGIEKGNGSRRRRSINPITMHSSRSELHLFELLITAKGKRPLLLDQIRALIDVKSDLPRDSIAGDVGECRGSCSPTKGEKLESRFHRRRTMSFLKRARACALTLQCLTFARFARLYFFNFPPRQAGSPARCLRQRK